MQIAFLCCFLQLFANKHFIKKTLHTLLLLLCAQFSYAQKLIVDWTRFVGGDSCTTNVRYTMPTNDGGLLFTGLSYCNNKGDIPPISYSLNNLLVGKLKNDGQIAWVKMYGGNQYDFALGSCATKDNCYLIVGNTSSSDGDVSNNVGNTDIWVIKVDQSGNKLWDHCYGSTLFNENTLSIAPTEDSGFVILGQNNGAGEDIPFHYTSSQLVYDWFLLKIDKNGNKQWVKIYGGSGDEGRGSVLVGNDGYYIIGGSNSTDHDCNDVSWQSGKKTSYDYYILKTGTIGTLLWSKSYGGTAIDLVEKAVWNVRDSSITIIGISASDDLYANGSIGEDDMWVINIGGDGQYKWGRKLGSVATESGSDIVALGNNYFALGVTNPFNTINNPTMIAHQDCWLFVLDTNGNIETDKVIGGLSDDYPCSVLPYRGALAVIGNTTSMSFTEGTNLGNKGSTDQISLSYIHYFAAKINEINKQRFEISVYPNPTYSKITINFPNRRQDSQLSIINVEGKVVQTEILGKEIEQVELSTNNWPPGIYSIIWTIDRKQTVTRQVIKY